MEMVRLPTRVLDFFMVNVDKYTIVPWILWVILTHPDPSVFSWESKVPPQSYPPPINSRPYDQGL